MKVSKIHQNKEGYFFYFWIGDTKYSQRRYYGLEKIKNRRKNISNVK